MGRRILIVDDDRAVCQMLKSFLIVEGFWVSTANSVHEAIGKLQIEHPSIILLDVNLPSLDFDQMLEKLKLVKRDIKIILASGCIEEELAEKAAKCGANGYLTKPFNLISLRKRLKESHITA